MPLPEKVPLEPLPTVTLLVSKPVTASEKVKVKVTVPSLMLTVLASLSVIVTVGLVVSITRAALAPREPAAPGAARVRMALLPAASVMVPPLRVRALAES